MLRESKIISFSYELNRTYDSTLFNPINNGSDQIPMYEGKYMNQFKLLPSKVKYGIKSDQIPNALTSKVNSYRIALRTVASATNQRSLIATLLPPNTISSNSLVTQNMPTKMKLSDKLFILGVLNSYVLDFILRQLISINVNNIYLRRLPLPQKVDFRDADKIIEIVAYLLKENTGYYNDLKGLAFGDVYQNYDHDQLIADLNARIMIDFNLTRQEVVTLMHTFESANHMKDVQDETQRILDSYDRLSEEN